LDEQHKMALVGLEQRIRSLLGDEIAADKVESEDVTIERLGAIEIGNLYEQMAQAVDQRHGSPPADAAHGLRATLFIVISSKNTSI
jgi:hypothetical protein